MLFAILVMSFVIGILTGVILAVVIAVYIDERETKMSRMEMPENSYVPKEPTHFTPNILKD